MVDSGANDNYVSQRVVPSVDAITTVQGHTAKTAEGEKIAIQDEVRLTLHFNNFHDTSNAQVFDRKFDIILGPGSGGYNQLSNWQNDNWPVTKAKKVHIISPMVSSVASSALTYLVSAKQTEKLLKRKEAKRFLVHIKPDTITHNVSTDWQTFLNGFQDVFKDSLPGLPPERAVQHIDTGDAKPITGPP